MKVCRKCKKEYDDELNFCPQCGTSCDKNIKPSKTTQMVNHEEYKKSKRINKIVLYFFGVTFVLRGIIYFTNTEILMGFSMLFLGMMMLPIIWDLIEGKFNLSNKLILILKIILPIFFFIFYCSVVPPIENTDNKTNYHAQENIDEDKSINEEKKENQSTQIPEITQTNPLTFTIEEGSYGDYGKDVKYDGKNYIEYFIPIGKYSVEILTSSSAKVGGISIVSDKICKNSDGYDENCDEKDFFNKDIGSIFEINVPDGYHVMLTVNCNIKFIKLD